MAQPKPCRKCQEPHWGFQKCAVKDNQQHNVSFSHAKPNLPDGWRPWNVDYLEDFERRGKLIVQRSGMILRTGSLIEPKENHD